MAVSNRQVPSNGAVPESPSEMSPPNITSSPPPIDTHSWNRPRLSGKTTSTAGSVEEPSSVPVGGASEVPPAAGGKVVVEATSSPRLSRNTVATIAAPHAKAMNIRPRVDDGPDGMSSSGDLRISWRR